MKNRCSATKLKREIKLTNYYIQLFYIGYLYSNISQYFNTQDVTGLECIKQLFCSFGDIKIARIILAVLLLCNIRIFCVSETCEK